MGPTDTVMPELRVQVGDIATADADVVVVSANTALDFEGRAGQAIADACGPQVAVELATIKARRQVRVGEVCATGAGRHHRIKAIFWAVVRDHRPETADGADDAAAVETAARALWRALLDVKRKKPFTLALVPVGAIEIGSATSAAIFARTLAGITQLHPRLARVIVMTNRAVDIPAIEAALQPWMKAHGPRSARTALTPITQQTQQQPERDTHLDNDANHDDEVRSEDPTVPLKAPKPPKGWSGEATAALKPKKPR